MNRKKKSKFLELKQELLKCLSYLNETNSLDNNFKQINRMKTLLNELIKVLSKRIGKQKWPKSQT